MTKVKNNSTGRIFKASILMIGTSAVSILVGIIRNKMVAVMLGPESIGLMGLLQSILNTAGTIAGAGLAISGVRQLAEAQAIGDNQKITNTSNALLWTSVILGLSGALLLIMLRKPIASLVFGHNNYAWAITWIGIGVWASIVSSSQTAVLNGLRRLVDLAKTYILGALGGLLITVLAVWHWRESGIIAAVISTPLALFAASWWLTRRIKAIHFSLSWKEMLKLLPGLFRMGFALMSASLVRAITQLAVRVLITRTLGMVATGYFQAAWSISMLYLGFILDAISKDYYPRLSAVAHDYKKTNAMVNEQIKVVLLMAGPVILGMLTLCPQVVGLIYSGTFKETAGILQWQVIGDLFKFVSWCMIFVLVVKERSRLFFVTELFWNLMYLALVYIGMSNWNLKATGIAYFLTNVLYFCLIWIIVFRLNHFVWRKKNLLLLVALAMCAATISIARFIPGIFSLVLGLTLTAAMSGFSLFKISRSLGGLPWNKGENRNSH
ncbi:O-antigen translocase [Desulfotruncus alcoholivorax]|uniref:O-antigen translocase n=1 Tax=Desulfotruncus alcoholivorax TaxID=265477 RepID=UPI000424C91C|nr:O-antigen translocase [Desulfotruncus alcoholivorax]